MNIITLTDENLAEEHICCAISSKSTIEGVVAKKEWLVDRIKDGLRFKELDVRGKTFIEYIPAENAWLPIDASGYMLINCFWVSGAFKGHGYGKQLLTACEEDAKKSGFKGVVAIVGNKKKPYLTDKSFLLYNGYEICDSCEPYFELVVKSFNRETSSPKFKDCARKGMGDGARGIDIFYTVQCPFTIPYTEMLQPIILSQEYPVRLHQIKTKEMAQEHIAPVTTYCVFVDGVFYTNEILTSTRLEKLIEKQINK